MFLLATTSWGCKRIYLIFFIINFMSFIMSMYKYILKRCDKIIRKIIVFFIKVISNDFGDGFRQKMFLVGGC